MEGRSKKQLFKAAASSTLQTACKEIVTHFWPRPWAPRTVYYVNPPDSVTLCTLGIGTAFGECVLDNSPHSATVVTNEYCELLRIEQKDFRSIWEDGPANKLDWSN